MVQAPCTEPQQWDSWVKAIYSLIMRNIYYANGKCSTVGEIKVQMKVGGKGTLLVNQPWKGHICAGQLIFPAWWSLAFSITQGFLAAPASPLTAPLPQPAAPSGAQPPALPSTAPPRTCGCDRARAMAACVSWGGGTNTAKRSRGETKSDVAIRERAIAITKGSHHRHK